jgi:transcriptional regulator with XRE-family HTH domain
MRGKAMDIGEKLKKVRKIRKYRLKDLAEKTNLSISYLSDIENGRSTPPLQTLQILCETLDIPMYELFREIEPMLVKETARNQELYALLEDFNEWDEGDKNELLSYLRAKRSARKETPDKAEK